MFAFSLAILAGLSSAGEIAAVVDPRVEAMCIVFRLAGNPEYARTAPGSKYVAAALEHFEPFKKHAAVKLAAELRRKSGISFDAPMSLAVHLEDVASAKLRVPLDPWPATLDRRWTTKSAPEFAAALADFVRESDFDGFMKKHAPLQRASAERLHAALRRRPFLSWLDEFYGPKPKGGFVAIVGMMAGPNNYGVSAKLADGTHELSPVLGVASVDAAGLPVFGGGIDGLIIHEFSHAYVNPLVDANIEKLAAAGEKLFKLRERAFRQQAYGDARTVLYESLVRACETKI
ncbi:MAG TPA: DUF4932 domain-containing protein, partial [Planctomycetia bacterium]|nr:DUF4932 domain-containing protein [Planctomycetia bacterium]